MQPIANTRRDDIVYKQLLDNIKAGVWKSGDKLPTENELSKELNVSRVTIRAALQRLRSIGLVESKHGKGTFVCPNEDLFDYTGFSDTINLTAKEFDLLELLMTHPNKVYSREELLNTVWGYDYPGDVRTVDVHIRRLREKIETTPSDPKFIHTKWGVGYYFQK